MKFSEFGLLYKINKPIKNYDLSITYQDKNLPKLWIQKLDEK